MPMTEKEYRDIVAEFGERGEHFTARATALLHGFIRRPTRSENAEYERLMEGAAEHSVAVQLLHNSAMSYKLLRDLTLESSGFPAWQELTERQRRGFILRFAKATREQPEFLQDCAAILREFASRDDRCPD